MSMRPVQVGIAPVKRKKQVARLAANDTNDFFHRKKLEVYILKQKEGFIPLFEQEE